MMTYDMGAWFMVKGGLRIPSHDEKYMMQIQVNAKAKRFLYGGLDSHNFNLVSSCSTSKEIWEKLEHMYGKRRKEEELEKKKHNAQQVKVNP